MCVIIVILCNMLIVPTWIQSDLAFSITPFALELLQEVVPKRMLQMEEAIQNIIDANDFTYAEKMFQLPEKQKELLLAIGQEGKATRITSVNFVKRHKIYSTSTVQSACNGLLDKELITEEQGQYFVYDKFFELWLRQNY